MSSKPSRRAPQLFPVAADAARNQDYRTQPEVKRGQHEESLRLKLRSTTTAK